MASGVVLGDNPGRRDFCISPRNQDACRRIRGHPWIRGDTGCLLCGQAGPNRPYGGGKSSVRHLDGLGMLVSCAAHRAPSATSARVVTGRAGRCGETASCQVDAGETRPTHRVSHTGSASSTGGQLHDHDPPGAQRSDRGAASRNRTGDLRIARQRPALRAESDPVDGQVAERPRTRCRRVDFMCRHQANLTKHR